MLGNIKRDIIPADVLPNNSEALLNYSGLLVGFFLNHTKSRPSNYMTAREAFCEKFSSIFWWTFFWSDLSLSPLSVQSPFGVQCSTLTTRAPARVVTGGTGGTGWTGWTVSKKVLYFFSFWDILNTILIYTYIQKKSCPDKYLVGLYFGQVGELPQRFSKSHC